MATGYVSMGGKTDALKLDPRNARRHSERNRRVIRESLKAIGGGRSILVDGDNIVRAGNGVYEQARELGLVVRVVDAERNELIAVRRRDLRGKEAIRAAMLDNIAADSSYADYNADVLAEIVRDDDLVRLLARQNERVRNLLRSVSPDEAADDAGKLIDHASALQEKWRVARGDVWQVASKSVPNGYHRVMCGDATSADDVRKLMDGAKAEMVFTDPPYGVAIGDKKKFLLSFRGPAGNTDDIVGDTLKEDELYEMLVKAFTNCRQLGMSNCCAVYVTSPQGGGMMVMMAAMRASGLPVRHGLVWVKNSAVFSGGRLDYDYQHEPILFTWTKTHKRYGLGQHKTSVWFIDRPPYFEHPTMKPVALVENAILNSCSSGAVVFDFFLGSGTTLVACEQTGRVGYGMEIEPRYVAVSLERLGALGLEPERVG